MVWEPLYKQKKVVKIFLVFLKRIILNSKNEKPRTSIVSKLNE